MSSDEDPPTLVAELSRLLDLRADYRRAATPPVEEALGDADVMALAFLAGELGLTALAIDGEDVLAALRAAKMTDHVAARANRPCELRRLADPSPRSAGTEDGGGMWAAVIDARHAGRHKPAASRAPAAAFIYGMRGPVEIADLRAAASVLDGPSALLSLAGLAPAFWRCTSVVVVSAPLRAAMTAALARMASLVSDRSLDPLMLVDTCLKLQGELQGRSDEPGKLEARLAELQDEVRSLKNRLLKQQQALAALQGGSGE